MWLSHAVVTSARHLQARINFHNECARDTLFVIPSAYLWTLRARGKNKRLRRWASVWLPCNKQIWIFTDRARCLDVSGFTHTISRLHFNWAQQWSRRAPSSTMRRYFSASHTRRSHKDRVGNSMWTLRTRWLHVKFYWVHMAYTGSTFVFVWWS